MTEKLAAPFLVERADLAVEDDVRRADRALERPGNDCEALGQVEPAAARERRLPARDPGDRPVAVPFHLVETSPTPTGTSLGKRREHGRVLGPALARSRSGVVLLAEEEPVLLVAVELRRHERPHALEALPLETNGQAAVALLLQEVVGARVPDLDGSCSVLARRDLARERRVLQRVVLDVDGEMALPGLERHALRHGPARQGAVALQAEVVVEASRIVALHDEDRFRGRSGALAERLGRGPFRPLALVLPKARHGYSMPVRRIFTRQVWSVRGGVSRGILFDSPTGGLADTGAGLRTGPLPLGKGSQDTGITLWTLWIAEVRPSTRGRGPSP